MLSKPILFFFTFLGLATIGSSYTLPKGAANGVYRAYYNEAGEEVHELIGRNPFENETASSSPVFNNAPRSERRGLRMDKRNVETWCGCNYPMNAGDTNIANAGLASQIASHQGNMNALQAFWTVQNTAVAFVCNRGTNPDDRATGVPVSVVEDYAWQITQACGCFIAGTARLFGSVDYGYMNYDSNAPFFCQNAEGSPQHSC